MKKDHEMRYIPLKDGKEPMSWKKFRWCMCFIIIIFGISLGVKLLIADKIDVRDQASVMPM